ncbi:hypothetical protein [Hydrogenophaga sp. BPS33]|uniref:hypothetical protein n=1 Tax=Hydrogenophaga sp. BPS33 TaxID=2651974 RepID=UPI0013202B83|nr:hypothetical protein [Hydrogenophaga sp. BPS33]QHE89207.1 hypothetical protein F9K07_29925 [Hydrogenophaga sp. BPS33]
MGEFQERQLWGGATGVLPGLDGQVWEDRVVGEYLCRLRMYREFEQCCGYQIDTAPEEVVWTSLSNYGIDSIWS